VVGLCDFPPAVFLFFGYSLAVVPVAAFVALAFPFTVAPIASAVVPIAVTVAAVPIASAVVAVIVAVPAAPTPAAPLKSAALAQLTDLPPVMFGLATEPAVALNVAVELPFLVADALEASVVPITRLGSGAGQHGSAQKHRRAQCRRS